MKMTMPYRWAPVALALIAFSCDSAEPDEMPPEDTPSPVAYTAKVKNLLTGLEVTDEEAQAVTDDPAALPELIDQWMETPQFREKMIEFFKQAFQQTQIGFAQFEDQIGAQPLLDPVLKARMVASAQMSFPLTALELIDEGRPFTETLTTERFMLNPALMSLLAYIDNLVVDDEGAQSSWLSMEFGPDFQFVFHYDDKVEVPLEESVDPDSPNFLHFYEPCPVENGTPSCNVAVIDDLARMNQFLLVYLFNQKLTDADFDDWRMVSVRPPGSGEDPSIYWNLPSFRSTAPDQELVLDAPRVGFMTTPAFFANWPTNLSNLARATVNQSLIVGLGYSLADSSAIVPVSESGNPDAEHSQPGTTCYACHQTLDPMRNFFRQSFSVTYHPQTLELPAEQQEAVFLVDDAMVPGTGVRDFAAAMAQHPRFASAWTQKLCQYASSSPCDEDDPEFARVSDGFRDSNYDFKSLVRELFSSPLVTLASQPQTDDAAGAVTISRRDHFCAALDSRLGLPDACELSSSQPTLLQNLAFGIPGAGYTRGASSPLLPREPNLFFSSSVEGLCGELAQQVVDPAECLSGQRCFDSSQAAQAIDDMVRVVMALPSIDPRFADVRQILTEHNDQAAAQGHSATDALRSTFVLACTSPLSNAIGL